MFFKGFWLQRLLKKASRGPRWLPKDTRKIQDPKNRNPKLIPKIIKKIGTNFWTHSKTQAQLKKSKKRSILKTPFPRISGIQIMPRQKVNERGEKSVMTGIILYKRKGGIAFVIPPHSKGIRNSNSNSNSNSKSNSNSNSKALQGYIRTWVARVKERHH